MSTGYVLSPRAQSGLDNIWDYTEQQWSAAQAERYTRQIQESIEFIAEDPRRGRSCDDIRAGYYKHPAGSHVIFYRLTSSGVDVVRILHAHIDFDRHL
jgi:toxin ParE1/3/4